MRSFFPDKSRIEGRVEILLGVGTNRLSKMCLFWGFWLSNGLQIEAQGQYMLEIEDR